MVELKKCCNHPFLFESADHGYGGDTNSLGSTKLERIILSSGKLVILDKLLNRLHETKHRVLIFSQVCSILLFFVVVFVSVKSILYYFKMLELNGMDLLDCSTVEDDLEKMRNFILFLYFVPFLHMP